MLLLLLLLEEKITKGFEKSKIMWKRKRRKVKSRQMKRLAVHVPSFLFFFFSGNKQMLVFVVLENNEGSEKARR